MRYIITMLLMLTTTASFAGVMSDLKETPASKYDLGKLKLEIVAFAMAQKLGGEGIDDTRFEVVTFQVVEAEESLELVLVAEGKAKYLSDAACADVKAKFQGQHNVSGLGAELWPNVTKEQQEALSTALTFSSHLVSRENQNLKVEC